MTSREEPARQQPEEPGGRFCPYPEGRWVKNLDLECLPGRLVTVGKLRSTDFTLNLQNKKQTRPISLKLSSDEYISKVIMSGGFYDPRIPSRHGVNGMDGLCVRSIDPSVFEQEEAVSTIQHLATTLFPSDAWPIRGLSTCLRRIRSTRRRLILRLILFSDRGSDCDRRPVFLRKRARRDHRSESRRRQPTDLP